MNNLRFSIGDCVVYDGEICRVTNVGIPSVAPDGRCYYFLKPMFYIGMIYTPVDTGIPMRPVIDRDEALRLVRDIPGIAPCMCPTRDKKAVREHYAHLMQPNTCRAYAETLVTLRAKRRCVARRTASSEDQLAKNASQRLCDELSVSLGLPNDEVREMIERALSQREDEWTEGGGLDGLRKSTGRA